MTALNGSSATYVQLDSHKPAGRKRSAGGNGGVAPKPKPKPKRKTPVQMVHHYPPPHPHVVLPSWVWPLMINVFVMILTAGISYGLIQGKISSLETAQATMSQVIASQAIRIDGFVKEQDRVTRLEVNLQNIATLLQEIRKDLREGRHAPPPKK